MCEPQNVVQCQHVHADFFCRLFRFLLQHTIIYFHIIFPQEK